MSSAEPTLLKNYQPPSFFISTIDLDIDIQDNQTFVKARLEITKNFDCPKTTNHLVLNGVELSLRNIFLDQTRLNDEDYKVLGETLTVYNVPNSFFLETLVSINPKSNSTLSGLYVSKNGYFTQCEAEGFRRITFYLDRPDIMARFTTKIKANKHNYPILLSNGNLVASGRDGEDHWAQWEDPFPKPSYLFAMVAANLAKLSSTFQTLSGRGITLNIFAQHGKTQQCVFAMEALKKSMEWDEKVFGLEIDLDQYTIVAVDDFNMGAMENKGLNIFNSKYILAQPELSTDKDYMFIDRVVAHEYFHNWTGNRVTCRDWFQLSLKEGLTVFRDQEYGADMYSRATQRIQEVRNLRGIQFPEDASPMAHAVRPQSYIEINNFYTATVYEKGAELVRMIYTLIGQKKFRQGMDLYFIRHDGSAATTDDFVEAMQDASQYDLSQFKLWYDRSGTPKIVARGVYNQSDKSYELNLSQFLEGFDFGRDTPMHIPIAVGFINSNGKDLRTQLDLESEEKTTHVLSLKKQEQTFLFQNVVEKPVISLLRGFSAPVSLEYTHDSTSLTHQMAYDSDSFNRWEASQILSTRVMLDSLDCLPKNSNPEYPEYFFAALNQVLLTSESDPAFTAEMITLPSEIFLAEKLEKVYPEKIHFARRHLVQTIAKTFKDLLLEIYTSNLTPGIYCPDHNSSGKRALKNICLQYLMELANPDIKSICMKQFKNSNNMTDTISSLVAITNNYPEKRNWALENFYNRWEHEPSAIDKWFSVQAATSCKDTLDNVKKLTKHKAFDYTNPNKVYSLIRTFGVNHYQFHQENGEGYQFLAEQILVLDAINPQVAARISRCFDRCRRFDNELWMKAHKSLLMIYDSPSLSTDTREVISKTINS